MVFAHAAAPDLLDCSERRDFPGSLPEVPGAEVVILGAEVPGVLVAEDVPGTPGTLEVSEAAALGGGGWEGYLEALLRFRPQPRATSTG